MPTNKNKSRALAVVEQALPVPAIDFGEATFERARAVVAAAESVSDVLRVRLQMASIQAAIKRAIDHRQGARAIAADAFDVRNRAERRIGEMLAEGKDDRASVGGDRHHGLRENPSSKPTLAELGIDKATADRCRKLAAKDETAFEAFIRQCRRDILHPPPKQPKKPRQTHTKSPAPTPRPVPPPEPVTPRAIGNGRDPKASADDRKLIAANAENGAGGQGEPDAPVAIMVTIDAAGCTLLVPVGTAIPTDEADNSGVALNGHKNAAPDAAPRRTVTRSSPRRDRRQSRKPTPPPAPTTRSDS